MINKYLKLFVDCLETYKKLSDAEFGRLIRAALTYQMTGEEIKLTGREELLWDGMKLNIDRANDSYDNLIQKRIEAGIKGAEARWNKDSKNSKCHLPYSKEKQTWQEKDKDKDKEKEKEKKKKSVARSRFTPPTLDEVRAYVSQRGSCVDPVKFFEYFSEGNWHDSKGQPVQNWKQKLITWENKQNGGVKRAYSGTVSSDGVSKWGDLDVLELD